MLEEVRLRVMHVFPALEKPSIIRVLIAISGVLLITIPLFFIESDPYSEDALENASPSRYELFQEWKYIKLTSGGGGFVLVGQYSLGGGQMTNISFLRKQQEVIDRVIEFDDWLSTYKNIPVEHTIRLCLHTYLTLVKQELLLPDNSAHCLSRIKKLNIVMNTWPSRPKDQDIVE